MIASQSDSQTTLQVSGNGAEKLFQHESGGHRWQRVPPTEKGGRVHSSTVTVAVLGADSKPVFEVNEDDIEFRFMRGSGPGGQKRNKTETCVVATHLPTGLTVRCDDECSQKTNKRRAVETIRARLQDAAKQKDHRQRNDSRKTQVGSGMRSDKVRTVQVQNGKVIQHTTGKTITFANYCKGKIENLSCDS